VLSGRGLCDELITRPEESYRLCCVVVCDLETSGMGAPYIYDISHLRVKVYAQRLAGNSVTNIRIFHSAYPALRMCIAINADSKVKYYELDSRSSLLTGYCDSLFTTSSMTMRIMKPLCDRYWVQIYSGLPKYRQLWHTISRQSYTYFYLQHSCYSTCFGSI